MIYNKKDVKRAVEMWNLGYKENIEIIIKEVKNYDYKDDNGTFWKKNNNPWLKRVEKPYVKRNFIYVDGEVATEPLTDYLLIKEVDGLEWDYGSGRDIISILTGKKGTWLLD